MKRAVRDRLSIWLVLAVFAGQRLVAQEASSGLDLRATLSGRVAAATELTQPPRSGSAGTAGFRSVFYPTWKMSEHWTVTGAMQVASRPYFLEDYSTKGYGVKGDLLQASLNYSRISDKGSILMRAGEMPTAFGSFPLRYDDAENPLIDLPIEYGYYTAPVSDLGLAGVQLDVARGKWDARAQFTNSSPANPRSLFARDQYGNWTGGAGYTIRQGFRVGASAYRGPYLDRKSPYFFPGETNPGSLSAHALGVDVGWAHGHWNLLGEVQKFVMPYTVIPTFREQAGYAEARRVLSPRWYLAARAGYSAANATGKAQNFETTAGFRPDRFQIIKLGYEFEHYSTGSYRTENAVAVQIVTTFHRSVARN